jgi:hypothetical protein
VSRSTAKLTLKQHDGPRLLDPSWPEIETALREINPRTRGYFILSRGNDDYVQTAGAKLRLICEWRTPMEWGGFRHYVLGRPDRDNKPASINTCSGIVQLRANEILPLSEVMEVFRRFFDGERVAGQLAARDDTASHIDRATK